MRLSTFSFELTKILTKLSSMLVIFYLINYFIASGLDNLFFKLIGDSSSLRINYVINQKSSVFVFGASRAKYHVDANLLTDKIGRSVTNAGSDGKNSTYQLILLNLLLEKHTPDIIVYEAGDYFEHLNKGIKDMYPYYYVNKNVSEILNKTDKFSKVKFILPLYRYNGEILSIVKWSLNKADPSSLVSYSRSGSILKHQDLNIGKKRENSIIPKIDSFSLECFNEFVRICRNNHIKLIFTCSPWYQGVDLNEISQASYIAKKYGIRLLNFSDDERFISYSDLFYDEAHLNNRGSELYTICLSDSIISLTK